MKHSNIQTLKLAFAFVLIILTHNFGKAQQSAMQTANTELRHLFQNISNPNPNVNFFYDLSGHFMDSAYFNNYVTDTSNMENWYSLYQEMYFMAYDTTQNLTVNNVFDLAYPRFQSDTIPIAIIDWDFNLLKEDALNTDEYFIFDQVNDVLYDKPGAPSPFTIQTTFAGAALQESHPFVNPVFEIDPVLIFKDVAKNYDSETILKIDFDDGTGWHPFNGVQIQYYQALYSAKGVKTLKFGVFQNGTLAQYSISAFTITSNSVTPTLSYKIDLLGLTANVYQPDPTCNVQTEQKFVIFVSGYDVLDNTGPAVLYQNFIVNNNVTQLKNFGYTFVVVDWVNSHLPIEVNALYLINLIEHLKCMPNPGTDVVKPKPPFVIMAHSMGGLVTRFALTTMESPLYISPCKTDGVAHNTRLFIAVDSPHQGANIPLAYQYFYRYASLTALSLSPSTLRFFSKYYLNLQGASAQMLKYHIDTDIALASPISISPITEHPAKTLFDAKLASLGNYPKYCKLVAISNGSWLGAHQRKAWDPSQFRTPNDKFLSVSLESYLKVLGVKILGTKNEFSLLSNPNGSGMVFSSSMDITHWKLDVFWFGVKLVYGSTSISNVGKTVLNVKPYCTMPGSSGLKDDQLITPGIGQNNSSSVQNGIGHLQLEITTGNGNVTYHANAGSPLFGNVNVVFNAYSDGFDFGYIPTASAFDYNMQGAPLDQVLLQHPVDVGDIMNRTPFDVVFANPTEFNRLHNHMRGEAELEVCATCKTLPNGAPIHSYLINREIGDDALWLENLNANYLKPIEAERDIFINHRNIYYNYDGANGLLGFNIKNFPNNYNISVGAIVLSKKESVQFTYPGQLRSNNNLFVNGAQPPIGSFSWQQGVMSICCINYNYKIEPQKNEKPKIYTGSLNIYPNPTKTQLTIKYQMQTNSKVTITATNMLGRQIAVWKPPFSDHTQECYYAVNTNEINWPAGVYIITVSNGTETYHSQLLINK